MGLPGVLYAELPYVPPPPPAPFVRLPMTWEGWDGSVWDLTDPDQGLVVQRLRGLDAGDSERYAQRSPGVAGTRTTGYQDLERPAFWQVLIYSDANSAEWQARYRAFMRTVQRGRKGVWSVTGPDGATRSLTMEFVSEDTSSLEEYDPALFGWSQHSLNFVAAEQPFWTGVPERRVFSAGAVEDFLPATGGPPFNISDASTTAKASIANPGDVRSWPQWWAMGPLDAVDLGADGQVVEVPFEVADGRWLIVDARPTYRTAIEIDAPDTLDAQGNPLPDEAVEALVDAAVEADDAVDRTAELGAVQWAPVAEGDTVPLDLTIVGTGAVRVKIVPQYHRALA